MMKKIVVALLSDALLLGGVVVIMVGLYTIWPAAGRNRGRCARYLAVDFDGRVRRCSNDRR